jgi:two-component system sensor histidine kinase QseC
MHMPRSLQGRLLAPLLVTMICVWLATAVMTWFDAKHELDELLDSHLAQAASLLLAQQVPDIDNDEHDRGVDAPVLHRYAPKVAFQVFHEGRLVLRSANAPSIPMTQNQSFKAGFESIITNGTEWRIFATYGAERDIQVYVGEQLRSRNEILLAILRSTLWPMALALPLLALGAWWTVLRSTEPLRQIGRMLAARRPQELNAIVVADAPTEMQPMLAALNDLFDRIASLIESERRFTADAAHELRTPIAAIRAQAQVALGEADDAQRRHALLSTLAGCDRAAHLIEQLLTLARLDAAVAPEMTVVDLGGLAKTVAAEMAPKAIDRNQSLELDAEGTLEVSGNTILLAVLLRNLVDNAIRYCPDGARIRVGVCRKNAVITVFVEDSGPGLTETDRTRLGERFFRVSGTTEAGSGLGWSIVRRVATVHSAELRINSSAELGGLGISVSFRSDVKES